ncbi:MAG: hypothetical protein GF384_03270 [Elusimicrobia bacterium]|nr:hypothetical protein [Elusimicrobiota bacterium]
MNQGGFMFKKTVSLVLTLFLVSFFPINAFTIVEDEEVLAEGVTGTYTVDSAATNVATNAVDVADFDKDGVETVVESIPVNGSSNLYYLGRGPIHRLLSVTIDSVEVEKTKYTYKPNKGWISFKNIDLTQGDPVITYERSSDLDIIAGNGNEAGTSSQHDFLYKNDQNFEFSESELTDLVGWNFPKKITRDVASCDYDRDGDIDFACAHENDFARVYRNLNGTSLDYIDITDNANSTKVAWADYDSDGDFDLGVANKAGNPTNLFKYIGASNFIKVWDNGGGGNASALDFGDFDSDGDMDMLIGNNGGKIELWKNEVYEGPFILVIDTNNNRIVRRKASDFSFVDSDDSLGLNGPRGIAVDDLYIYIADTLNNRVLKLRKMDYGLVAERTLIVNPLSVREDTGYVYVSCNTTHIRKLFQDGLIDFGFNFDVDCGVNVYGLEDEGNIAGSVYHPYVNGALIGAQQRDKSNFNTVQLSCSLDTGVFQDPRGIAMTTNHIYVSFLSADPIAKLNKADMSLDSSLPDSYRGTNDDQLLSPQNVDTDGTYLYIADSGNNKISKFRCSDLSYISHFGGPAAGSGDDEFDGPCDVAFDEETRLNKYVQSWTSPSNKNTRDAEFADFDNDGLLDIVVCNFNEKSQVYLNQGTNADGDPIYDTTAAFYWEEPQASNTKSVKTVDIDGDGYLDLVFGVSHASRVVEIYLNDGTGHFDYEWGSDESDPLYSDLISNSVAIGDFNDDGKPDIVAAAEEPTVPDGDEYHGVAVFKNPPPKRMTVITATVGSGINKNTVIGYYNINEDGSLGTLIHTETR